MKLYKTSLNLANEFPILLFLINKDIDIQCFIKACNLFFIENLYFTFVNEKIIIDEMYYKWFSFVKDNKYGGSAYASNIFENKNDIFCIDYNLKYSYNYKSVSLDLNEYFSFLSNDKYLYMYVYATMKNPIKKV